MSIMMGKAVINGIKFSPELVLLSLADSAGDSPSMGTICRILNRINMPFITAGQGHACCVPAGEIDRAQALAGVDERLVSRLRLMYGVGLLSIFPHRSSLKVLGLSMRALGNVHVPFFGMASSLAALTFVVRYGQLDAAAASLAEYLALPDGYVPLGNSTGDNPLFTGGGAGENRGRPPERIMETSAVYRESEIKIYGFQEAVGLWMLDVTMNRERISRWGSWIGELDHPEADFNLVLAHSRDDGFLRLRLLFSGRCRERIGRHIRNLIRTDAGESFRVVSPVELIYFHGPHFGDRYGIADSAFRVLTDNHVPIVAAACSGAAIYLVLQEKGVERARPLLGRVFGVPQAENLSKHP